MPNIINDPSIRGVSFDQLLKNRGIKFTHRRAVPCPNIQTVGTNAHNPNCKQCDGNGILYYCPKEITGTFTSNSLEKNFEQQGLWEVGTAMVTMPAEYDDGTQADFQTYDQLIIDGFTVRIFELDDYVTRTDNSHQMRYPIENIDFIASVPDNCTTTTYTAGTDFNIVSGNIEWIAGKEPTVGTVLTVSYFAKPVYVVLQQMRELRVTQELQSDGSKIARRLPQQLLVKRDFLANLPETTA